MAKGHSPYLICVRIAILVGDLNIYNNDERIIKKYNLKTIWYRIGPVAEARDALTEIL